MKIKLILLTVYIVKTVSSNYYEPNAYYPNPSQQEYYEYDDMDDYDNEPRHHRRRHGDGRSHHYNQEYRDDCSDRMQECSCSKCDNPSPCCQTFCASCQFISGQPNLFFVPYPYPLMVPGTEQNTTDWAQRTQLSNKEPVTTTTEKVTTTVKASTVGEVQRTGEDFEMTVVKAPLKLKGGNNRYMLTSLRRTKPTWVPKYGIVPIPDNLAEKLMSQLREVKDYNYRAKETLV